MDKEGVAHIYNGILAIKRNKIELFVVRWMDLEIIILSEVSQTEKDKYTYDITYMWNLKSKQRNEYNKTDSQI